MSVDAIATLNLRHVFTLLPELVLAVGGLVVLAADLGPYRKRPPAQRGQRVGRLTLGVVLLAILAAVFALLIRFNVQFGSFDLRSTLNFTGVDYTADPDPSLFFGTLAGDLFSDLFNLLFTLLLFLVVWFSTVFAFTENWGEYFALMLWSTVGMMLLTASEELLTLFLTLETMTICLYLLTAFERETPIGGSGLEVFRLRLGLLGLIPVRPEPGLRHHRQHVARCDP